MPCRGVVIKAGPQPATPKTFSYPLWYSMFGGGAMRQQATPKPTPYNLQRFAEYPIVRAAINQVKDPIAGSEWEIRPRKGLVMTPDIERRCEIVRNCLETPNRDDSFRTLIEQLIDDTMTVAGAVEMQASQDPEHPLYLFPVDGSSIRVFIGWSGNPDEARYAQYSANYGQHVDLRNDELMYVRMNPRSSTPFGLTPVEVAYNLVNAFTGAFDFADKLAGNATPGEILDLGPNATGEDVLRAGMFWQDSVEAQGEMPIIGGYAAFGNGADGKAAAAQILKLTKGDDADLRIGWQQWLVRLVALSFGLSPQSLNLETTVNRATAEVMDETDRARTLRPMARLVAENITREAIHRKLGWYDLEFGWVGMEPEDDESEAKAWQTLDTIDALVPDEVRELLGKEALPNGWGRLTQTQRKILIMQARGAKSEVADPGTQEVDPNAAPEDLGAPDDDATPDPGLAAFAAVVGDFRDAIRALSEAE